MAYSAAVALDKLHWYRNCSGQRLEKERTLWRCWDACNLRILSLLEVETISDSLLAYAMTLALPESWTTQKQALWMETKLPSEKVASAIRAEWQRRQMEGKEGTALNAGRFQPRQGGQEKKDGPWCDHRNSSSHSNAQCYSLRDSPNIYSVISTIEG